MNFKGLSLLGKYKKTLQELAAATYPKNFLD